MQNLEVEIQHWLKQAELQTMTLDQVADLVSKALKKELSNEKPNLNSGFTFFVRAGCPTHLFRFVFDHLWESPEKWPWKHLLISLGSIWKNEKKEILTWLLQGATETQQMTELTLSPEYSNYIPQFQSWKNHRRTQKDLKNQELKDDLLNKLMTFRSQQLYDPERQLLKRLEKMFPLDNKVKNLISDHKKRYASEILNKKNNSHRKIEKSWELQPLSEDDKSWADLVGSTHLDIARNDPRLKKDLILSALIMGLPDVALKITEEIPSHEDLTWLTLDVFILNRKFAEVLAILPAVEVEKSAEPETFFSTAYLRAQAMYGLGQKETAIEILESLLNSRPNYRTAETLLNQWRLS